MQRFIAFALVFGIVMIQNVVSAQRLSSADTASYIDFAPDVSDQVIEERIASIDSDIKIVFNSKVRGFIDYFSIRNRNYTRKLLTRQHAWSRRC